MRLSRINLIAIVIGTLAAAMTLAMLLAPDSWTGAIGEPLFGFGLILASIPLGGLHNDPSAWLLLPLAALVNAGLWGGLIKLCLSILRGIIRIRSSA